jgi:hypothetical protein
MSSPALLIRPRLLSDLGAVVEIDAHAVAHGTNTFELDVPDRGELGRGAHGTPAGGAA